MPLDPLSYLLTGRSLQAVLLSHPHVLDLSSAVDKLRQGLQLRFRQGAHLGTNRLAEVGQNVSIDPVALGQFTRRLGEVANLARIDHHRGQPCHLQARDQGRFQLAGRLEYDPGRMQRLDPTHQSLHAVGVIRHTKPLTTRSNPNI